MKQFRGFLLLIGALCGPGFQGSLDAAAWPLPTGRGQVFLNFTSYRAGGVYDANGSRKSFPYGGSFRKMELNPYIEYGLSTRVTLVGSFFAPAMKFEDRFNRFASAGTGDAEAGARVLVYRGEATALSVQGMVKAPTYPRDRDPAPGNHQYDYEGRLLVGRSFQRRWFWNLEGGYRFRSGFPADQVRADFTLGAAWGGRWMGLIQMFTINGLGGARGGTLEVNPNLRPSFDLYKVQASLVCRLREGLRVQAGYSRDVYGRQVGAGHALLVSLWKEF